jgi:cytochrome c oxidase subunit 2
MNLWSILGAVNDGSMWMPKQASTVAPQVDNLFYFILWVCVFFFALITVLTVIFVIKYRHREGHTATPTPAHSTALELTWTVIPTILVLMMFYFGFKGYMDMAVAPPNSYEIQVTGQTWSWSFTYPNGYTSGAELHVPKGVPIRMVLTSQDVIHSLYIPNFRLKKDAVPGRYNRFWFEATDVGEYPVYCAEYCGTQHSEMLGKVVVHEPKDFADWLEKAIDWEKSGITPVEAGKKFYERCKQCHSIDGSSGTGPSFKDLWGREEELADGSKVLVDENYVLESITNPNARIVKGFASPSAMPTFKGQLKEPRDINAVIAYLKTISTHTKQDANVATTQTAPATQSAPATQPK